MYKVYLHNSVEEIESLSEAKEMVASEWDYSGQGPYPDGFHNPWIEDENGNEVPFVPKREDYAWMF